jgi:hypothetical protein
VTTATNGEEKLNLDSVSPFRKKNQRLAVRAVEILEEEKPMTLRQLFYRLISAGALANRQEEYKRLGHVMTVLREKRTVPLDWMVDNIRDTLKPSSWTGLADFGESVRDCYRRDFWASMPHHVEVFVEKDAVAGTIQPVTIEHNISLNVCRGYASISFAGGIAETWKRIKKPIYAYYLGDFDPSGFDIERDLKAKLERYSGRFFHADGWESDVVCSLNWRRLAVEPEDFENHDLIRLPVKAKDNRSAGFIRTHGDSCAEVDALAPSELRRRVQEAIEDHIDTDRWNKLIEVEALEQETLNKMVLKWKRA